MAIRDELFTTEVMLDKRSYFFNVKENRNGDVFLQIVESKKGEGDFDRHQIAIFAEDMQKVLAGLDDSLKFIEKDRKERAKIKAEKKAAKEAKYGNGAASEKRIYRKKNSWEDDEPRKPDGIKRTGKVIHIKSKKTDSDE